MNKDLLDTDIWVRFKGIKPYVHATLEDYFDDTEDLKNTCGTANPNPEELTTAILDKLWADHNYDMMCDLLCDAIEFYTPKEEIIIPESKYFY